MRQVKPDVDPGPTGWIVMAGLDPAISFTAADSRVKPANDEGGAFQKSGD
jgi:hypothetical protein